jgi:amidase
MPVQNRRGFANCRPRHDFSIRIAFLLTEIIRLTARQTVGKLKSGEITPLEAVDAAAARIESVDGAVNALPTLCLDRARDRARAMMAAGSGTARVRDRSANDLAGLPIAVKDLNQVEGVRTTQGSPIFADHISPHSDFMVEQLERNGAIVIAKSNTPEFGAGANTFNEVFGRTYNPWGKRKNPGGSSGGSAAALATGQVWLATGSDLGGSLRIPAAYCSVVGLRPSPGRVSRGPGLLPFGLISVEGPMARNVADVALMLDAQAGPHPRDPISLPAAAPGAFQAAVDNPAAPKRIAFSADLGIAPVDPEVAEICRAAAERFTDLGAKVEAACPDLAAAEEVFDILRAEQFAAGKQPLLERHRDQLKPEVIWNIEHGLELTAATIGRAERLRGELFERLGVFFESYDFLVCPTVVAAPFDGEIRYLEELNGKKFENYVSWLILTFAFSALSVPAISLPCGFTTQGLPVGLQIVGRPRDDAGVLGVAKLLESVLGLDALTPIEPRPEPIPVAV